MAYSEITFQDKNPVKRWLQQQRLLSALMVAEKLSDAPSVICDFGAGNGELCLLLAKHYPNAHVICYEPTIELLNEAKENLKEIKNIRFVQDTSELNHESIDLVFSLEVFEHLPPKETDNALKNIHALLKSNGHLIIGVPVEIGIPALYKGVFRMTRRYGAFDANLKNVIISFLGKPPTNRPMREIAPGFNYHFEHVGFDHRKLFEILKDHYLKSFIASSPFPRIGAWLMPEVYIVVEKS